MYHYKAQEYFVAPEHFSLEARAHNRGQEGIFGGQRRPGAHFCRQFCSRTFPKSFTTKKTTELRATSHPAGVISFLFVVESSVVGSGIPHSFHSKTGCLNLVGSIRKGGPAASQATVSLQ